ncbi:MAG: TonB-dependent receptor plug domain-containing protein, partial [Bacteroidales bacterium]|nr:TonB-dependent receptor plug domain-containing protein [Bacteroidales bacterium]
MKQSIINIHLIIWMLLGTISLFAQQEVIQCTGIVSDLTYGGIPGASVIIKGTTQGTITDVDGNYILADVPSDATLTFTFIGMKSQEVLVAGRHKIDVTLMDDVIGLEEVVAVGYGISRKMDVTGATSSISADELNQGAVTNPLQQMSGRAAGVNISQVGSEPGASPSVRIRGITSLIGGNDPLVVVDGIQGNMDLLNQVPPSEIASIDILKDASSTAIYGSRGAPGVIIITTKKSKEGKFSVEYNGTTSTDFIAQKLDVMTANEWRQQAETWGVPQTTDHGANTDWYDILSQTGKTQNHTISFGGNAGGISYRASLSAVLQEGVVINSSNDYYIARIQATQKALNDKLVLNVSINNSVRQTVGSPSNVGRADFSSNLISNAYVAKPTDPVLFQD